MQVCRKHFWWQRKGKHWWAHSFGQGYYFKIHSHWQYQFDKDVASKFMLLWRIWGNPILIGFPNIPIMNLESYPDSFPWDSDFAYSRTKGAVTNCFDQTKLQMMQHTVKTTKQKTSERCLFRKNPSWMKTSNFCKGVSLRARAHIILATEKWLLLQMNAEMLKWEILFR